ncbi:hypothetical protein DID74_01075 [Candidatus Marinamargulisbacteria bacterium SCGC AG-333-B06]|nr:hypothetical protein DID74_01075 [Candidatus Marinamargulisbacteria bacterium SCGC AG-333-B06]
MTHIDGHNIGPIQNNNNDNKSHKHSNSDIDFNKILEELAIEQEDIITKPLKEKSIKEETNSLEGTIKPFYNPVVDGGISGVGKNKTISNKRYQELHNIVSKLMKIQLPHL